MKLTLYYAPNACSLIPYALLTEAGAAFDVEPVNILAGAQFLPEFLRLNPKHKVPVLVRDGVPRVRGASHRALPIGGASLVTAPAGKPYVLLDAGGTLCWPHAPFIRKAALGAGQSLGEDALFRAYYRAIHRLDLALRGGTATPPPAAFFSSLLIDAGVPESSAGAVLQELEHLCTRDDGSPWNRQLWTYPLPWTRAALESLRDAGFRMSVVSNSDGTVAQALGDLGFATFFEHIFDSHLLGVEKPDPRIFEAALQRLGQKPGDCVYAGDVFMVDVVGANRAGIDVVHLDPLGLYAGWPGRHTQDLQTFADELLRRP